MTVTCPTCGAELRGLLDTCTEPACLTADLDHQADLDRRSADR